MEYDELFERNYGIFDKKQQKKLRESRILIIGTGGIGGFAANCFARAGVENFVLSDFDDFDSSNMNRQIFCNIETLGKNKAEMTAEALKLINPSVKCEVHKGKMSFSEIGNQLGKCDFVFPAADDFPFSLTVFRMASRMGVPSLIVVPSGLWARVSIIPPGSEAVEKLFGLPVFDDRDYDELYKKLKDFMNREMYKKAARFYLNVGGWRRAYFREFVKGEKSPTQICPLVWFASSAGVFESVKYITGKGKALQFPRYLEITGNKVKQYNLKLFSISTYRIFVSRLILKRRLKFLLKSSK